MDLELFIVEGTEVGRTFEIREGANWTLGRAPGCEIRLEERGVSRRHCDFEHSGSQVFVRDLGSANGTFVNGKKVTRRQLDAGDELSVGPIVLECRQLLIPLPLGISEVDADLELREETGRSVIRKVVARWAPEEGVSADDPGEIQRAQRSLAAAYQVSNLLVQAKDVTAVFEGVLSAVFENNSVERAALLLREGSGGTREGVRIVASRCRTADVGTQHFVVSRTVIQDVILNGVSVLSWDAVSDHRFSEGESIIRQSIRSVVCSPISGDEGVLGVLYMDNLSQPGAFSEIDVDLLALIGNQAGAAIQRTRLQQQLQESLLDTIRAIVATIDAKDGYTHRHSERVAAFAVRIAREMGRSGDEEEVVRLAALVHDVGKVGVSELILNKPGPLTAEEFEEMKRHAVYGYDILQHVKSPLLRSVLPGVRHHHEHWDGSGYPDRLAGEKIPFLGRLLAVADVLDAVSSGRPYHEAEDFDEAVGFLSKIRGTHLDPKIVDATVALHSRGRLRVPKDRLDSGATTVGAEPGLMQRLLGRP